MKKIIGETICSKKSKKFKKGKRFCYFAIFSLFAIFAAHSVRPWKHGFPNVSRHQDRDGSSRIVDPFEFHIECLNPQTQQLRRPRLIPIRLPERGFNQRPFIIFNCFLQIDPVRWDCIQ